MLVTGMHTVCDINCISCHALLGWKYKEAQEESQVDFIDLWSTQDFTYELRLSLTSMYSFSRNIKWDILYWKNQRLHIKSLLYLNMLVRPCRHLLQHHPIIVMSWPPHRHPLQWHHQTTSDNISILCIITWVNNDFAELRWIWRVW